MLLFYLLLYIIVDYHFGTHSYIIIIYVHYIY